MRKQWKNSSNSIKNLPLIIIIKDGSGCSFLGFVWPWNVIIPTSWGNALHLPPPTCPFLKKDSSHYVIISLWRGIKDSTRSKKKKTSNPWKNRRSEAQKEEIRP